MALDVIWLPVIGDPWPDMLIRLRRRHDRNLAFRISSLFTCVKMWAACSALSRASCSAGWSPAWSSSTAGTRRCCRSTGKEMVIMLQSSSKKIATPSTYLEEEGADHVPVRLWHDPQLGLGAAQLALVVHSSPLPVPAHKFYLYFALRHQGYFYQTSLCNCILQTLKIKPVFSFFCNSIVTSSRACFCQSCSCLKRSL